MVAKNDVTGDSIMSKVSTDKFRTGFDAIFKKPEPKEKDDRRFDKYPELPEEKK